MSDLCRREGIKPHSYYAWTKEFMEAGKERLTRDAVRDATQQEVHQLKRENVELKQLVAELSLEGYRLREKRPSRCLTTPQVPTDERCREGGGAGQGALAGRITRSARLCIFPGAGPGIPFLRSPPWRGIVSKKSRCLTTPQVPTDERCREGEALARWLPPVSQNARSSVSWESPGAHTTGG